VITFGPVPSRRLGRSLGINNMPPKVCSYACVYCQLGRTPNMQVERQSFFEPQEILREVQEKLEKTRSVGEVVDYLSFVPDGEPTLDVHLGSTIDLLRTLGIPIAVISNSSLLWRADVRRDLARADWVSLKMDAVDEEVWRSIDRPHGDLQLGPLLEGALEFTRGFRGELATETMLVHGLNDQENILRQTADFVTRLRPTIAYLSVPLRPPAEKWVLPPTEEAITRAYQVFSERINRVECLIHSEDTQFAYTGNLEGELLSITSVHPMREEAVRQFLAQAGADWSVVERLIEGDQLVPLSYQGGRFYARRLRGVARQG